MSISSTIATMRKNEILSELPKMDMNSLHASRAELKKALYSKTNTPDTNKQEIADITIAITREIHKRAEAEQAKTGTSPEDEQSKIIQAAQDQRKHNINTTAQRKLSQARETFDNMNGADQFQWMENNGRRNPHEMTINDFGGSE